MRLCDEKLLVQRIAQCFFLIKYAHDITNVYLTIGVCYVQHFSLNTTLNFLAKYLSCWMKIVQHDLRL